MSKPYVSRSACTNASTGPLPSPLIVCSRASSVSRAVSCSTRPSATLCCARWSLVRPGDRVAWGQCAAEPLALHAQQVGEWITTLGDHPSLAIGPLLESHQHDIGAMLRESLEVEGRRLSSTANCCD